MSDECERSTAEETRILHENIDSYSVLFKAAKAKGLKDEERRCQRIIDDSRHAITELKSTDERKNTGRRLTVSKTKLK